MEIHFYGLAYPVLIMTPIVQKNFIVGSTTATGGNIKADSIKTNAG
jgi:hypothetical protein